MSGSVILNWVLGAVIILLIIGVPLWLTMRRRHARPDYREARSHYNATAEAPSPEATSDFVPGPNDRTRIRDGLTIHQERGKAFHEAGDALRGDEKIPAADDDRDW
ncbi:MAG TPA: hypothetical protein VG253_15210 [Streptosporangiaceae bacterium]|nr:hypothetical protein [Streptosporangiaceae bacterium]